MLRMIFTVTVEADTSLESSLSRFMTPELLERTVEAEIAKVAPTDPGCHAYTVKVSGGGPFTEMEEYRVWLREIFARASDP